MNTPFFVSGILDRLEDRLPAIVVKEARQAVRSRFVASVQMLLLILLVVILGVALLVGNRGGDDRYLGQGVFFAVRVVLHGACVLGVPLYVGVRLAAERSESNTDLLFSTTIKPWSVVAGKLVSGLLLGLLAMSACAPFMALCYFLRGVSVAEMGSAMWDEAQVLLLATMVGLFIGALPVGAVIKVVVALVYTAFALGSFGWMVKSVIVGSHAALAGVHAAEELIRLLFVVGCFGLFFFVAVAMLSPPTSNRAFPVRAYLSVAWVLSAAVGVLANFGMVSSSFLPFKLWVTGWSVLLAVAALVAVSERDRLGPRVRAQITTLNGKVNAAALMLFSGAASGIFFTALMTAATLLFCVMTTYSLGWLFTRSTHDVSGVRFLVLRLAVANAMTLGYGLLAGGLRRRLWPNAKTHTNAFVALALIAAGAGVPLLGSALLHGRIGDWETTCVAFPFTCALADNPDPAAFAMAAALAVVLLAAGLVWSVPWLAAQLKAFKEARPMALGKVFGKKTLSTAKEAPDAAG